MFTVGNVDRYIGRRSGWQSIDTRSSIVNSRSIVGRQSVDMYVGRLIFSGHRYLADTWPTLGRYLADSWPTLRWYCWYLTDTWPTLRRHFADTSPTLRWHFADTSLILDRYYTSPTLRWYFADTWPILDTISQLIIGDPVTWKGCWSKQTHFASLLGYLP